MDLEQLKRKLTYMGYERVGSVEARGQYSIRGGIIDVYPPNQPHPCRVELFDIEVDSIRFFNPLTQRSIEEIDSVRIFPAQLIIQSDYLFEQAATRIKEAYEAFAKKLTGEKREKLASRQGHILESLETATNIQLLEHFIHYIYEKPEFLWDYLKDGGLVVVDDPDRVAEAMELVEKEYQEDFKVMLDRGEAMPEDYEAFSGFDDFQQIYRQRAAFVFTPFQKQPKGVEVLKAMVPLVSKQATVFNGRMDFFEAELLRYDKLKFSIYLLCSTSDRVKNMEDFISRCGLAGEYRSRKACSLRAWNFRKRSWLSFRQGYFRLRQSRRGTRRKGRVSGIKAFSDIRKATM